MIDLKSYHLREKFPTGKHAFWENSRFQKAETGNFGNETSSVSSVKYDGNVSGRSC